MASNTSSRGTLTKIRIIQWPFYVWFKRHRCCKCNAKLKLFWINQNIFEHSFETRGKNLTWRGIWGKPVNYTFAIFKCKLCGHQISIPGQRKHEKPNKTFFLGLNDNGEPMLDDYTVYLAAIEKEKRETKEKELEKQKEQEILS